MRFSRASVALLGAMGSLVVSDAAVPLISEYQPNPPSDDPNAAYIELSGNPGESLQGSIVFIESDQGSGGGGPGDLNDIYPFNGTFDDSTGLLLVLVENPENPSFTIALVSNLFVDSTLDIDPDNDGTIGPDVNITEEFGTVYDAIGVPDQTSDEDFLYGAQLGGADFKFITGGEPTLIFREKSVNDWYAVSDQTTPSLRDINNTQVQPDFFNPSPPGPDPFMPTIGQINPTRFVPTTTTAPQVPKDGPPCNPTVCQACFFYCGAENYNYQCVAGGGATGQACEVDPWCAFCARVCPITADSNDDCPGGCLSNPDDFVCPTDPTVPPNPTDPTRKLGFLAAGITSS